MPDPASRPAASPVQVPYPPAAVGWYATIVLALLYWLSILDRFIISLLVDPIKRDMGITDVQFVLLHGCAFAITYALFGTKSVKGTGEQLIKLGEKKMKVTMRLRLKNGEVVRVA